MFSDIITEFTLRSIKKFSVNDRKKLCPISCDAMCKYKHQVFNWTLVRWFLCFQHETSNSPTFRCCWRN